MPIVLGVVVLLVIWILIGIWKVLKYFFTEDFSEVGDKRGTLLEALREETQSWRGY